MSTARVSVGGDGTTLSHRAEIFRSKLIEDFQILESTSEQGKRKVPIYSSTDITDVELMEKCLREVPDQMIKFKAYRRGHFNKKTNILGYKLTRVADQKKLPYGVWANIVVESGIFQNSLLFITLLSSVTIGIQGELPNKNTTLISVFNMLFDLLDNLTVIVFSIEIALKWLDNFKDFWKDEWNIFDLVITVVSAISTVLLPFAGSEPSRLSTVAEKLSVFRVLRVLKLVTRLSRLRIVILTVLQTFQSVVFIILLLLMVSYVYALVGVIIFQTYSSSQTHSSDLVPDCFSTIPKTMLTLFQLFTLDQWYNIYQTVASISDPVVTLFYIIIWIGIGSFIFRNLFVGIMVNNFQSLSAELVLSKETQGKNVELARLKRELSFEIIKHNKKLKQARHSVLSSDIVNTSTEESKWSMNEDKFGQIMKEEEKISKGWDETVDEHLAALASNPVETLWPRDTLFRYYQVMEQLQDNLEEHDRLQEQIVKCLLELHKSGT